MKNLTDGKSEPLLVEDLQEFALWFAEEVTERGTPINELDYVYYLGVYTLERLMGNAWLHRHVGPSANKRFDYFRVASTINAEQYKNTHRVIRVAESLFNYQGVQGFSRVVKSLKTDHRGIESIVAELEAATILDMAGIPFAFVEPMGKKTNDYDIDISYPNGWIAAVDIKCKIEGTNLSSNTVRSVLEHARKQLPSDRPCFVLLKVPDEWPNDPDFDTELEEGLSSVLTQSRRLTSVFTWWEDWLQLPNGTWKRICRMREEVNPQADFGPGPVKGLAKLTWNKKGDWVYLAEIIRETIDVPDDGSVVKFIEIP